MAGVLVAPEVGRRQPAHLGEEATVKHVYYERDALRLKSSNPAFPDLVYGPEDNPVVQGRVIGVVRWLPR